jgi:branched-subunit amino acid permease
MGARWLAVVGFLIVLLGTLPFALADAHTNEWLLMTALLVRGVGLGTVTVPLMALGFRGLERHEVPDASIITRIAQQVGGSFGTAVLAVILAGATTAATSTTALTGAFQRSFWWAIGFTAAGVLISLVLPGRPSAPTDAAPAAAEASVPAR